MDWFIPEMVSGLKRNGCPDNPGIGGWIAPEYAPLEFSRAPLCLLISKNAPNAKNLMIAFNRGLAKLRERGQIEIMHKDLEKGIYD